MSSLRRVCLLSCAMTLLAVSPSAAADPTAPLAFEMQDQFAATHKLADLRGEVVVLVYSDRGGAEASRDLGAKLHVHFHPTAAGQPAAKAMQAPARPLVGWPADRPQPDAKIIAIAVIGDVPGAIQPLVRSRFRAVAPDGEIWLDMRDQVRALLPVAAEQPNVAVLDKTGRLRHTTAGTLDDAEFEQLTTTIDALRLEAPQTPGPRDTARRVPRGSNVTR